jgi:hypothetical protein
MTADMFVSITSSSQSVRNLSGSSATPSKHAQALVAPQPLDLLVVDVPVTPESLEGALRSAAEDLLMGCAGSSSRCQPMISMLCGPCCGQVSDWKAYDARSWSCRMVRMPTSVCLPDRRPIRLAGATVSQRDEFGVAEEAPYRSRSDARRTRSRAAV